MRFLFWSCETSTTVSLIWIWSNILDDVASSISQIHKTCLNWWIKRRRFIWWQSRRVHGDHHLLWNRGVSINERSHWSLTSTRPSSNCVSDVCRRLWEAFDKTTEELQGHNVDALDREAHTIQHSEKVYATDLEQTADSERESLWEYLWSCFTQPRPSSPSRSRWNGKVCSPERSPLPEGHQEVKRWWNCFLRRKRDFSKLFWQLTIVR